MAKPGREPKKRRGRAPKEAVVAEMSKVLEEGQGFILCNNKGISVAAATKLRQQMRENNIVLRVVKNRLLKRALENSGISTSNGLGDLLKQETVIAVGMDDPVMPAKLLVDFQKDNERLQVKGGFVDGKVLDASAVVELSKLPGREELLQRLLGSLMSPAQKFVYALNDAVSKPVYLMDALRRKKEEEAA